MIYENLKLRIQRYKENKIITDSAGKSKSTKVEVKPFETFVAAAIAKCVAIVATYPHEVVRIRLRESANGAAYKYTGFVSALKIIAKEEESSLDMLRNMLKPKTMQIPMKYLTKVKLIPD